MELSQAEDVEAQSNTSLMDLFSRLRKATCLVYLHAEHVLYEEIKDVLEHCTYISCLRSWFFNI